MKQEKINEKCREEMHDSRVVEVCYKCHLPLDDGRVTVKTKKGYCHQTCPKQ